MDDKLKIIWNLDVLVKMCRSKSDGPSLRVEESEISGKLDTYQLEISEIKSISEEESYDSSAEMADRNIEIITKKQLQTLNTLLKEKNKELNHLKEEENKAYGNTSLLRETKASYEKYILSMQDRINSVTDSATIDRYNNLINETSEKIESLLENLKEESKGYETIQDDIISVTEEVQKIEEKIEKKKKLLAETQANLENKESYIDKTKKEKNNKRIKELEEKSAVLSARLEEIHKDPKYIETKIKDIINSDADSESAKPYIIDLINIVIRQPYINIPDDNKLEEELLKATQARDAFANSIDKKSYNILEAPTPEKTRISFLEKRIEKWQEEYRKLQEKVRIIDQDKQYNYKEKEQQISEMITLMEADLKEFQKAYDETLDSNISTKASLKVSLDEKREDIIEAEKIAAAFRTDEAEDIADASRMIKVECDKLTTNILNAQQEIEKIKNRLLSKKSGLVDISSRNKDKAILKELAQTVIDLKHRRQFPETPIEVVRRLEEQLNITLSDSIDFAYLEKTKEIESRDYEQFLNNSDLEVPEVTEIEEEVNEPKRGIKVITEDVIETDETSSDSTAPTNIVESVPPVNEEVIIESLEEPEQPIAQNSTISDNMSNNEALANELDNYITNLHSEENV